MKALVLTAYNRLSIQDVACPEISESEVLVRVKACGICGSDVHGFDGSSGRRIPPIIMGHEAAGIIEKVGSQVSDWKTGDRVTFDSTVYRLNDWYTLSGRYNLSDKREVLGVSPGDYSRNGAFAEFVSIPQHILHKIPDSVSFEEAAMVEPVAVALHAVNRSGIKLGDSCAVVGIGTIGLFILKLLKQAGATTIVAIDLSSESRERAKREGADLVLGPEDQAWHRQVLENTSGRGVDIAFEAVGISASFTQCLKLLRKGGTAVLVGNLQAETTFPLQQVVTRELTLLGSCAICGEYPAALSLIDKGVINVKQDIAAVRPLSEGPEWFEKLYSKKLSGKVILTP